jgi:hypothetical protein
MENFIIPNLCFLLILSSFTWNSSFFFSFIFLPLLGFRFGCKSYTLYESAYSLRHFLLLMFVTGVFVFVFHMFDEIPMREFLSLMFVLAGSYFGCVS